MDGMGFVHSGGAANHPADAAAQGSGERANRLSHVVQTEVIPRLLLSRRGRGTERRPARAHVETLARLSLARDPAAAFAQIAALREAGMPHDVLLDDLIGPAARRLGEYWLSDAADFVEVTLGSGRLSQAVRLLGAAVEPPVIAGAPLALMATVGPERHGLGAQIASQALRMAGWRVRETPGAAPAALAAIVSGSRFDLIGLSLGATAREEEARALIARLRGASRNRRAAIAVGGSACLTDPTLAARLGADFSATEARDAVTKAQTHLFSVHEVVRLS